MEILFIALLVATGKLIVLIKFFPFAKVLYYQKWVDLFFTFALPMLFIGSFSGMATAMLSGLFLSVFLAISTVFIKPVPISWKRSK